MKYNSQRVLKKGTKHYAKKSLGQNFLIDPNIARWMVNFAEIGDSDVILEVGPGKGMLTKEILKSPCKYLHRMALIWGDVLAVNLKELQPTPTKVLANIPYNITTPLIWQIFEGLVPLGTTQLLLMLQLDLAYRLCAKPRTKDRSPLGITIERMGQAQIVKKVPPQVFWPVPRVESAIVQITLDKNLKLASDSSWRRLLRVAFARRRRTLINNLACVYEFFKEKDQALKLLEEMGLSPTVRAEELETDDWQRLYEYISSL